MDLPGVGHPEHGSLRPDHTDGVEPPTIADDGDPDRPAPAGVGGQEVVQKPAGIIRPHRRIADMVLEHRRPGKRRQATHADGRRDDQKTLSHMAQPESTPRA